MFWGNQRACEPKKVLGSRPKKSVRRVVAEAQFSSALFRSLSVHCSGHHKIKASLDKVSKDEFEL